MSEEERRSGGMMGVGVGLGVGEGGGTLGEADPPPRVSATIGVVDVTEEVMVVV